MRSCRNPGWILISTGTIRELEEEMLAAANNLEFEKAALLRDQIRELKRAVDGSKPEKGVKQPPVTYGRSGKRTAAGSRARRGRGVSEPF